jgi:hypothetical protein
MFKQIPLSVKATVRAVVVFALILGVERRDKSAHLSTVGQIVIATIATAVVTFMIYGFQQSSQRHKNAGRNGPVSRPISQPSSGSQEDVACIEITRFRWVLLGAGSSYVVLIDGVKVGKATKGRSVEFLVTPGIHTVAIRSGWRVASNELELNCSPGIVRSLTVGPNPERMNAMQPGLANLPGHIKALREFGKTPSARVLLLAESVGGTTPAG